MRQVEALIVTLEDVRWSRDWRLSPQELSRLDEQVLPKLQELARRPEWSVHLYVWSVMLRREEWKRQEIIDAVLAHGNPLSTRFYASFAEPTNRRGTNIPRPQ